MSIDTPRSGIQNRPVEITRHARWRWLQRIGEPEEEADRAIQAAWAASVPIGFRPPGEGKVRLHPPTEALLVYRGGSGQPVLVTVLDAVLADLNDDLNDDHLQRCPGCDQRIDPAMGRRDCPWCETPLSTPTDGAGGGDVDDDVEVDDAR